MSRYKHRRHKNKHRHKHHGGDSDQDDDDEEAALLPIRDLPEYEFVGATFSLIRLN